MRTVSSVLLLTLFILAENPAVVVGQDATRVSGRVTDQDTGEPLPGLVVQIEGADIAILTDDDGRYLFPSVPPGPQTLRVSRIGYATRRIGIVVPPGGVIVQDIALAVSALELEGIIVTADPVSRARGELGSASVIGRDAIRTHTATSLAGLLELVPGMPLSPPGLEGVQQVSLRSIPTSGTGAASGIPSTYQLGSFGTLVVMDGVPLSNNANLQSLGPRGEMGLRTAAGGGIDIRQIPASTIERLEVIRGLPSVRYGDLTQGTIVIDTRTGAAEAEVASKYDPRTSEGSWVWGRGLGTGHTTSLTFDLARSRSNPGLSDDAQIRLAAQVAYRRKWEPAGPTREPKPPRVLDTRVDLFSLFDDQPENGNIRPGWATRSRDRGFRILERFSSAFGRSDRLSATASYTRLQQRSWATSRKVREGMPFTDRLTPGRTEGRFMMGSYDAEIRVDGAPQLLYARLEMEGDRSWLGLSHQLQVGVELRREWNSGPGYQFDMEYPPQTTFNGVQGFDRPRPYDDIPGVATSSIYLGERVRIPTGARSYLSLQPGARVDLLHAGEWWPSGVRDDVFQPRLSVEYSPTPSIRVRGGWGHTAKTPSLASLYPALQYHDVVNVNYAAADPAERLAILTTSILDPTNNDLGFSRATKAELGLEGGWKGAIGSLVFFRDRIRRGAGIRQRPAFLLRERYQLSDSVLGNGLRPDIIEPPYSVDTVPVLVNRPQNHVEQVSEGVELSAFLPQIPGTFTRIEVQGTWIRTRQWSKALDFGRKANFDDFQLSEWIRRTPYWKGFEEQAERALVSYRAIHHQPALGLVLTATIQHNLFDRLLDRGATDTLSWRGYLTRTGTLVPVPPEDRHRPEYQDLRQTRAGSFVDQRESPADWLLGIQLTKTLPLDGRVSFWVFNAMDDLGTEFSPGVLPRSYAATRFGLELVMKPSAFRGAR